MSRSTGPPDIGTLRLDDSDDERLFDTPGEAKSRTRNQNGELTRSQESKHGSEEAREAQLRIELESVRGINKVIEGVIESLEKAKDNMDVWNTLFHVPYHTTSASTRRLMHLQTVHRTVTSASTLLNTWTRILSQTEHNQRLLLNPQWQGATQDLEDMENETLQRQQAAERRAAEEHRMREEAARRKEEEERRKAAATPTGTRGTRGRVRGTALGRGASSSGAPAGYVGVGGQTGRGRATGRAGSGIGRGIGVARGRGRGAG